MIGTEILVRQPAPCVCIKYKMGGRKKKQKKKKALTGT
jgi:hypothetical protein